MPPGVKPASSLQTEPHAAHPERQGDPHPAGGRRRDHRDQRGGEPLPLLAGLLACALGRGWRPPPFPSRAQRSAQWPLRCGPGRWIPADPGPPDRRPSLGDVRGLRLFLGLPGHLHREPRPARRYAVPRPGMGAPVLLRPADLPHRPVGGGPADDPCHVLPFAQRPLSRSPSARPLHLPGLARRFGHGRGGLCDDSRLPLAGTGIPWPRKRLPSRGLAVYFRHLGRSRRWKQFQVRGVCRPFR